MKNGQGCSLAQPTNGSAPAGNNNVGCVREALLWHKARPWKEVGGAREGGGGGCELGVSAVKRRRGRVKID